jgi:hypothetical protein
MTLVIDHPPSRRERKKSAIRERIIAKGMELFARHGIADVTVDQIAEAADVGKGPYTTTSSPRKISLLPSWSTSSEKCRRH